MLAALLVVALEGIWSYRTGFECGGSAAALKAATASPHSKTFRVRAGVTCDPRYPGGASQPFATRKPWPLLDDRFTLFLRVFRAEDGSLKAAFRNPEQHSTGGAMQFAVTQDGDAVRFTAGDEVRLDATMAGDRLRIFWPDLQRTIELTRGNATDFFPRPPGTRYVYARPPRDSDGWTTARARDVGFDEAVLTQLVQRLIDADPAARRASLIHSLVVARHGKLVLDEYFFGFDRHTPHDTRSAGKTFASILLGTARQHGIDVGPQTKLYDLLGYPKSDPRKGQITLAHLMTHTAGFACDDYDDASPGNENTMQTQTGQPDWWRHTLDLPMAHEPGRRYAYCSANMNLMGAALTTATKTWLPAWFDRTIARPLQFGTYHWNLMPTGEGYFGGGAFVRPRDLLKLGQLYLDGGVWRGRRIVDASWVAQSTAPHADITPATTGLDAEEFSNRYIEAQDGLAWHLGHVKSGDRTFRHYSATGNGGQILLVVPELDLVVVFTGGNYRQGGIWLRWIDDIVGGEIIRAIRTSTRPTESARPRPADTY